MNRHKLFFNKVSLMIGLLVTVLFLPDAFAQEKTHFQNPILAGFYPDPSITRVGEDYYLIHSTFAYFPGIPVFHSKDLVNWTQIGNVLDRPEQLELEGHGITRGLFAPTISHHNGTFFMITTLIDKGGNFVVTAKNPAGPWSNPSWLPGVSGIDPSIFFDEEGKAYVVYNSEAPDNKPQYDGHRTIRIIEFDHQNLKTVGEPTILVNGGVDISKKPVWIEGPHVYKKDGYYYLMAAEGGTSVNHSEVILRSENVKGPYVPYNKNPILTQRHLPEDRRFPVSATGHADLVETQNGEWWAVFLATRPYDQQDSYNIGRETFLAPVEWKEGWPIINPDFEEVKYAYPRPNLPLGEEPELPLNGNFSYSEEFESKELPMYWVLMRTPRTQWYSLENPTGSVTLDVRPETIAGTSNPSYIGRRQQHINGMISTKMEFSPSAPNEFAGLVAFQSEQHYYAIGKTMNKRNEPVVQLLKSSTEGEKPVVLAEKKLTKKEQQKPLLLKISFEAGNYAFSYATEEGKWKLLQDKVDGTFLSTRVAGGFVGVTLGLYATSNGQPDEGKASFDWVEYEGNDPVYKAENQSARENK